MSLLKSVTDFFQSDEDKLQKLEEQRKLERIKELADLKEVVSTPAGMRFIKRFLEQSGWASQSMRETDRDTVFACGERNVALRLLQACDEALEPEAMAELLFRKSENEVKGVE